LNFGNWKVDYKLNYYIILSCWMDLTEICFNLWEAIRLLVVLSTCNVNSGSYFDKCWVKGYRLIIEQFMY